MEFVFVTPRERLFPEFYPHGLVLFGSESWSEPEFVARFRAEGFFVERAYAERTPALKQIIPYCVVVRGEEVFLLKRLRRGGEARLFDKLSIGIGGHVNPVDVEAESAATHSESTCPIEAGSRRELDEELVITGSFTTRSVGILNDDSNPVGAVHVGLVRVVTVEGDVAIRETDVLEGRWASLEELRGLQSEGADFETWSALLLKRLDELLPEPAAATT